MKLAVVIMTQDVHKGNISQTLPTSLKDIEYLIKASTQIPGQSVYTVPVLVKPKIR